MDQTGYTVQCRRRHRSRRPSQLYHGTAECSGRGRGLSEGRWRNGLAEGWRRYRGLKRVVVSVWAVFDVHTHFSSVLSVVGCEPLAFRHAVADPTSLSGYYYNL